MKKEAQLEEYKFMEKVMADFGYSEIESKIKQSFKEILTSSRHLTHDGQNIDQLKEYIKLKRSQLILKYKDKQ